MAYSISNIISWAKISQYLSEKDIVVKDFMDGGRLDKRLSRLLYMARKDLEELYVNQPLSSYLYPISNWVYSLCGSYLFKAQQIASAGGSGTIVNPVTGSASTVKGFRIELLVQSGGVLENGDTSYIISYPFVVRDTVSVELVNANVPQGEIDQFSWTASYGNDDTTITFSPSVSDGMLLIISGLRYSVAQYTGTLDITNDLKPTLFVFGNDLSGVEYDNTTYAGYDLVLFFNGIGFLIKGVDYTVKTTGGFTLIGTYATLTYSASDYFVMTPNGAL